MAYGKKNHVNIDPLSYNICLLGQSKVGKTTLIKQVCEKLAGEDGYLFFEIGQERGADAIEGINYVNCPEWNADYDELDNSIGFKDVCDDIIENKNSEYLNLKAVIWDTYDQLINIAEAEAIRLWNKDCRDSGHPEKCAKSIQSSWSGFGRGEKKAMELMFDMMAELRKVGVATIVIGHVKTKDVSDVVTGETYQTLTSDQQQNYFNALKKTLHFLGLAYIDRTIVKENTGKKNIVTNKNITVNKVQSETRKIKFRDDNYAVDSGSRFADIVSEIDMDADQFITALTDAVKAEQAKSGKSFEETKKEQDAVEAKKKKKVAEHEEAVKSQQEVEEIMSQVLAFVKENKSNMSVIKPIINRCKEEGLKPVDVTDIDLAKELLSMIETN